jgi:predicted nuclease of predicted toxin-antitoxin system
MKVLVDMNLPPRWVETLRAAGFDAVHCSNTGRFDASDAEILGWAASNVHVVFTHDLDFGAILAATRGRAPSVLQLRTEDVTPVQMWPVTVIPCQVVSETSRSPRS